MTRRADLTTPIAPIAESTGPPAHVRVRSLLLSESPDARGRLVAVVAELLDAVAAALIVRRDDGLSVQEMTLDTTYKDKRLEVAVDLRAAAGEALELGTCVALPSESAPAAMAIATPLPGGEAAIAILKGGGGSRLAVTRATLEFVAAALPHASRLPAAAPLAPIAGLLGTLRNKRATDAEGLAALLQSSFGARQCFVCAADGAIMAMSPTGIVRADSPAAAAIRDLTLDASTAGAPVVQNGSDAHSAAHQLQASEVVALRLGSGRRALVALLIEPKTPAHLDPSGWDVVQAAIEGVALRPARSPKQFGLSRRLAPLAAIALVAGAMFVPVADRIRANAELEPEGRRFVTASFGAVIRSISAKPGQVVMQGDKLAELEGEALSLSRTAASVRAEEAWRRRDAALREKNVTEAELARLEGDANAAERDLLDWQLSQLVLDSPIDGVVLASPLEHSGGAPVKEGDVLVEIAPLQNLRLRADIPIEDLQRLPEDPKGELHLDGGSHAPLAVGGFEWAARAEPIDGRTVVSLRTTVENSSLEFRPGQKGVVVLPTGEAKLGTILFRGAWNALNRWWL